jgi:hypothetical protein
MTVMADMPHPDQPRLAGEELVLRPYRGDAAPVYFLQGADKAAGPLKRHIDPERTRIYFGWPSSKTHPHQARDGRKSVEDVFVLAASCYKKSWMFSMHSRVPSWPRV